MGERKFLRKEEGAAKVIPGLYFVFWFLTLLYFEGLLHLVVFEAFSVNFLYAVGFTAAFAGILALIMSFLPRKAGYPVAVVILALLTGAASWAVNVM